MALRCVAAVGKEILSPTRPLCYKYAMSASALHQPARHLSLSSVNYAKRILVEETDKVTTVQAEFIESPHASKLIKADCEDDHTCSLCALNLEIKHTDVLILSQFLRKDGCLLPKRITGLCNKQQLRIKYLVAMSQKAGLMPNLAPSWSKKDPKKRYGSKKYNRYFDEATLD